MHEQNEQEHRQNVKVLICGGRRWNRRELTFRALDFLHRRHQFSSVIHGAASGADTLAGEWARSRGVKVHEYPAKWRPPHLKGQIDRAAGFKRNQLMLDMEQPDLVIAFPGTGGTADMMRRSRQAGVKVINLANIEQWERQGRLEKASV